MKDMTIRFAQPHDGPALAKILERGWKRAFPGTKRKVTLEVFQHETEGETVLVAERKHKVLGFAAIYVEDRFLHHLYVEPSAHRKGIGTALLAAAHALSPPLMSLKTQASNQRARAFYAKHGYEVVENGIDGNGAWVRLRAPN